MTKYRLHQDALGYVIQRRTLFWWRTISFHYINYNRARKAFDKLLKLTSK